MITGGEKTRWMRRCPLGHTSGGGSPKCCLTSKRFPQMMHSYSYLTTQSPHFIDCQLASFHASLSVLETRWTGVEILLETRQAVQVVARIPSATVWVRVPDLKWSCYVGGTQREHARGSNSGALRQALTLV